MLLIDRTKCASDLLEMRGVQTPLDKAESPLLDRAYRFKTKITEMLKLVFKDEQPIFKKVSYRDYQRVLEKTSYPLIGDIHIFVPPGMSTDYLTYTKTLAGVQKEFLPVFMDNLRNYEVLVAKLLTNPELLTKLNTSDVTDGNVDKHIETINKVYSADNTEEMLAYKKVIKRNKDWEAVILAHDEGLDNFRPYPINEVHTRIKDVSETANTLSDYLHSDEYPVNALTVKLLADNSYEIARQVELFALLYTKQAKLGVALADNVNRLVQALK